MKQPIYMLIKPDDKQKAELTDLWHRVFGDSYDYIALVFESGADIFVKEKDGLIVSVLYLLDCNLSFDGRIYKGKYLYAAATDSRYRNMGIMAELISEAGDYCLEGGYDFISLLPADDGLYGYYAKFGYKKAMYRCRTSVDGRASSDLSESISGKEYFSQRNKLKCNFITFTDKALGYAISCLEYSSCSFRKTGADTFFIVNEDNTVYEEVLSFGDNADLPVRSGGCITAYCTASENAEAEYESFGMLLPLSRELERDWKHTDIYMNIALD